MVADMVIEAETLDDAINEAEMADLPTGEYCDGSFEVNTELIYSCPETYGEQKLTSHLQTFGSRSKKQNGAACL
jgi:hypothetical protein